MDDWRRGRRRLRDRLYGVVLIPGIALLVLWSIISGITLGNGLHLRNIAAGVRDVSLPAMRVLASAQKERTLSLLEAAAPGSSGERLALQREATDRALAAMRAAADPQLQDAPEGVRQRMSALTALIDRLPATRAQVDRRAIDRAGINGYYDRFVDAGAALFDAQARVFPDAAISRGALRAGDFFRAADRMARAASLATDGLRSDVLTAPDHLAFTRLAGAYHLELEGAADGSAPEIRAQLARLAGTPQFRHLVELENEIIARGPWAAGGDADLASPPPIEVADWLTTSEAVADDLTSLAAAQAQRTAAAGLEAGERSLAQVAIGSVLALVVVLAAILVALRVSRRLSRRLDGLRDDALVIADGQLPEIVARLRRGDHVDLGGEVARLDYGRDEIGQVAEAFNTAQRTAVAAAVREAQAREGVNNVFLGIAGRSQALVHRLLTVIDRLEREETDPDRMQLLFGLDHLATRARRNAENLIILGGGRSGRRWSRPIELADVLRSAVAETKHYARVRVQKPPELALHGDAVADTVHLLAELLDNATSFSPPESQVGLHSRAVAHGVVVEVSDRGLGMAEADRLAANAMLAEPPEFDAMALRSDSRLGLFVVARLAARHGIGVELGESAHGGTKAVVLLPSRLIVEPVELEAEQHTAQLPRIRSAAGDAPVEPVERADGPAVLGAEWADPDEQWPTEDPKPASGAAEESAEAGAEIAGAGSDRAPDSGAAEESGRGAGDPEAHRRGSGTAGALGAGGSSDATVAPGAGGEPDAKGGSGTSPEPDEPGDQLTWPGEAAEHPAGRHAVDAPTDPGTRAKKPAPSTQPFEGATDSVENTPTAEPVSPRTHDVTPSDDDWPTTHSYRSDNEEPRSGPRTASAAEPDDVPAAAWPPAERTPVPAETPEETTDETVAWPQDDAAADPTMRTTTDPGDGGAPGTAEPEATGPAGLPRRRRRASLAPELARGERPEPEHPAADRSPEQVRDVFAAIQRGTDRGRDAEPDEAAGDGGAG